MNPFVRLKYSNESVGDLLAQMANVEGGFVGRRRRRHRYALGVHVCDGWWLIQTRNLHKGSWWAAWSGHSFRSQSAAKIRFWLVVHSGRNLIFFFFKFPRVKKCKSVSTGATLNTHTRTQHTRDALTEGTARTDRSGTSNGNRWNNGQVADRSAGLRFLSVR